MRITIATGPFYPTTPAPTGAVQRIWSDLAVRFARRGHTVTILACTYPGQPAYEERDGLIIHRRTGLHQGKNIYVDILKDSLYSGAMFGLLPRADVLVTNAFWLPVLASYLRPSAGRVVVSVARVPKGQLFLYRRAARLHAVSDAIARTILEQAPRLTDKVKAIPNPIDIDVFVPPARARLAGAEQTILYTGRIHPEKGLDLLVRAAGLLARTRPGLRLKTVGASRVEQGGGGEPYVATLRSLAQQEGVKLEIHEPVFDRAGLAKVLQDGDVYCYPSLAEKGESFGVAPLEAMATGMATVVSDLACFREFIIHGSNGLVFDHRSAKPEAALAQSLGSLLDDPALADRMGREGRRTAERFGYEQVADEFLADFARLAGIDPSPAGAPA